MEKQSTSRSFAVLGTANIIVKFLAIIYLPFQTHILGDAGNGIVAKGMIVYTFLYSLSNAGLPNGISKLVSEQTAHQNFRAVQKILKAAYSVLLALGILGGLAMALGRNFIASSIISQKDASLMLLAASPTLLFTSVSCALRGYFQGRQNMVPVAVSNVLEQLFNAVFTVVFAWLLVRYGLPAGAAGTMIGTFMGALAASVFLMFVFFNLFRARRHAELARTPADAPELSYRQIYRQIALYSFPAVLNTIAVNLGPFVDAQCTVLLMATHRFTSTQAQARFGVYSYQFNRLFTLAIAFSTALVSSLIPAISEALALRDHKLVRHRVRESYKAIFLITIPSIAGISFLAQPIIRVIFFSHDSGADLVILGTWTAIFMTIQYVQSAILIGSGRPIVPSVSLIIGMLVKTGLNYALVGIPAVEIKGAIVGNAVGWIITIAVNEYYIRRMPAFRKSLHFARLLARPAAASLLMGAVCLLFYDGVFGLARRALKFRLHSTLGYICNDAVVILAVLLGAAVFFAAMVLIRGVNRRDIQRLPMGGRIYRMVIRVPRLRAVLEEQPG